MCNLSVFCFRFSLQVGVVFISLCGLVLHTIAFMKLLFNISPETELKFLVASYATAAVFIIIGYVAYILGLKGAALEEPVYLRVAGWILIFEFFYWVILTGLSFTGKCFLVRSVCVDNRCAERLYIQNGYWRTPILSCTGDSYIWPWDEGEIDGDSTSILDILPVQLSTSASVTKINSTTPHGNLSSTPHSNLSTTPHSNLTASPRVFVDGNWTNGVTNETGRNLSHRRFHEEQESKEEQIRNLWKLLRTPIRNSFVATEPSHNTLLRNVGGNIKKQDSSRNEGRSSECVNHGKGCSERVHHANKSQASEKETFAENRTENHKSRLKNGLNSKWSVIKTSGPMEGEVQRHEANQTLMPPTARANSLNMKETHKTFKTTEVDNSQRHRRADKRRYPWIRMKRGGRQSYNGENIHRIREDRLSKRRLNYPENDLDDLDDEGRAIPLISSHIEELFPREAEMARILSTRKRKMNLRAPHNISHYGGMKMTNESSFDKRVKGNLKTNESASGARMSEFEPLDDDRDSNLMLNKLHKKKGETKTIQKPVGRASENKNIEGGQKNSTALADGAKAERLESGNMTTAGDFNLTTTENVNTSTTENVNSTTTENVNITTTDNGTNTENLTTTNPFPPGNIGTIIIGPDRRGGAQLGPWTPIGSVGSLPHFIFSAIYAVAVLVFWYIYPILVFFSFADEIIAEEEEEEEEELMIDDMEE